MSNATERTAYSVASILPFWRFAVAIDERADLPAIPFYRRASADALADEVRQRFPERTVRVLRRTLFGLTHAAAIIIVALCAAWPSLAGDGVALNGAQAFDFADRTIAAMEALPVQAPAYLVPDHYDVMIRYPNGARVVYARPRYSFVAIDARDLPSDKPMAVYRGNRGVTASFRWNVAPWRHGHMMVVPVEVVSENDGWIEAALIGTPYVTVFSKRRIPDLPVMTMAELESIR